VIKLINERFVTTWIVKDDLEVRAKQGDPLAKTLDDQLEYPIMDLMFLTPSGKYLSRLNAYADFLDVHPDVSVPTSNRKQRDKVETDVDVFMDRVTELFGKS
jgi:hypothetical protein